MDRACKEKKAMRKEDNSRRISNMDQLKSRGRFFGDISYEPFKIANPSNGTESRRSIHDRLNNERMKALAALQKSEKDVFKIPHPVNNKENSKTSTNILAANKSTQLDGSDYVPFRRPTAINISDLVTDETINLESSSSSTPSVPKGSKVSFEPTEITGRSTLYNLSVNEILASSFAPKARNLCDTTLDSFGRHSHGMQSSNTSFSSSSRSRSLPRTADMSFSKNSCTEESFNGGLGAFSFSSAGPGAGVNESENFAPGELMESKLIDDEISWAQEYAAIPTAALSAQAKAKAVQNSGVISSRFNSFSSSNSMVAGDPNFSLGNFFNMRSDSICNIVKSKSPVKCRIPVALVDEVDNTVTTTSSTINDLENSSKTSVTPKIDNKTYTRVLTLSSQVETKKPLPRDSTNINPERKDSGNSMDSSYLLTVSAIDRALYNLDIESNSSGIGVTQQLLQNAKKSKSGINDCLELDDSEHNQDLQISKKKSIGNNIKINVNDKEIQDEKMILENKENVDPKNKTTSGGRSALCDTMSFSETLLNSSDMKNLQRSRTQSRSPLSPIDVAVPIIRHITDDGEDADNDEWPSTPITSGRHIRRTKSPRDKSPLQTNSGNNNSQDATTPVNSRNSCSHDKNNKKRSEKETKSMSSTRLDGQDRNSGGVCNFEISPNISSNDHHYSSSLVVRNNSLCANQGKSPGTASPTRLENSPMSSPNSYHLAQLNSPTPTTIEFRSPNLDSSSHSDRHLLSAANVRKVVSSPVGSESSSSCSYGTVQSYRSALSAASTRSVSRCSSSSEFSHRDGKQVPIKVTNMELSWSSVKLRSDSIKSMQIKNIINKRLVIRVEVSGPGFQIMNSQRSNNITLHSQECRTINICFCPTVRGVAVGKLSFHAPSGAPTLGNAFLDVPLFGYGGNASIIPQNIIVGPVGSPFVTMGSVCELPQPLERIISFYNKGPLLGFAAVTIDSIGLMMPRLSDAFEIHPRKILIPPESVVDVRIVFRPKRQEMKKLIRKMSCVITLANLRVICGDEANRQRIRRLMSKMSEEERCKYSSSAADMLWTRFPEEVEMTELFEIKENPSVAMDLASYCRTHEILLTINHDNMDDTAESSLFLADVDDTVLFRTIRAVADSPTPSNLSTIDEDQEVNYNQHSSKYTEQSKWSVSPQTLDITLNKKQMSVTLQLRNGSNSRQYFEVACNLKDLFHFTPSSGYVAPDGGITDINISLHADFQSPSEDVSIMVYMMNDRITVPVKIHN